MKVYIAGPYTLGDQVHNVRQAVKAGGELMKHHHSPFVPHLSHFAELMNGAQPYDRWLQVDEDFLRCCDAIIRLPGESKGADREVEIARQLAIPVFYSVVDFLEFYK